MYPAVRKLPLLGVEWADLYRRMKIQETVYELLNQEYELARIQEAKEIPTVNVIDPANLPEKKSFPPRAIVIAVGTMLCLCVAAAWILWRDRWQLIPANDPRKVFASGVREGVRNRIRRFDESPFLRRLRGSGNDQSEGTASHHEVLFSNLRAIAML